MPEKKRSVFMIVGWIMLALAILFIVFMLYQRKELGIQNQSAYSENKYRENHPKVDFFFFEFSFHDDLFYLFTA